MLTNLDDAPRAQSSFRYGTLQCGADTWDSALGRGRRVFSCDSRLKSDIPLHRTNYYRTNWANYPPLDLFVVMDNGTNKLHDAWMRDWGNLSRSKHLLVFRAPKFLISFNGKGFKSWGKIIKARGYDTHTWHIEATKCGASIWSNYVVTFCFPGGTSTCLPPHLGNTVTTRPCRNLIRTYGIHPSKYRSTLALVPSTHPTQSNLVGTIFGQAVYDWEGPCGGGAATTWILIPNFGIRKVMEDEMLKLKGVTQSVFREIPQKVLQLSVE